MKTSLARGLERTERLVVDAPRTIDFLGEEARVYSTPSMIDDVEWACWRLLGEHLDDGEGSVGVRVELDHLGATPLGHAVDVRVAVLEVDGRRVRFSAEVRDALDVVGRGEHVRFVVEVSRHRARIADKAARLTRG